MYINTYTCVHKKNQGSLVLIFQG